MAEGAPPTVPVAKAALRARVLGLRLAMTPVARQVAGAAIARNLLILAESGAARTITSYVSFGTEPTTLEINESLRAQGRRVLLPVLRPDLDLDWAVYDGPESLADAARGLREPTGRRVGVDGVAGADLVVVPAVAVGRDGTRLGRGGGSYDRALARVGPGTTVVALLYDGELFDSVPAQPHDRRVSAVALPEGAVRLGPAGRER